MTYTTVTPARDVYPWVLTDKHGSRWMGRRDAGSLSTGSVGQIARHRIKLGLIDGSLTLRRMER